MPISSAETFLKVFEKSALVTPDRMKSVRDQFKGEEDARAVARELIKSATLTKWQALQLLSGRHALAIGEYVLLDQIATDGPGRSFLARHAGSGLQGVLKMFPRDQGTDDPNAATQFLETVERKAAETNTKVQYVHRPDKADDRCYAVLAQVGAKGAAVPGSKPSPKAATTLGTTPKTGASANVGPMIRVGSIDGSEVGASAAPAPGGFAINTGPKKRRKKGSKPAAAKGKPAAAKGKPAPAKGQAAAPPTASAPATVMNVAGGDDEDLAEVIPKPPIGLIVGGAVGAGLLLTIGIVLTVIFFMSRGGDDPVSVAQTDNTMIEEGAGGEPGADTDDPDVAADDAESDPELDPVINVGPSTDSVADSDPAVPAVDVAAPGNGGTSAVPATTEGGDDSPPPGTPATTEIAGAGDPAVKPDVDPTVDAPSVDPAADTSMTDNGGTPGTPGETETPGTEPAPPDETPPKPAAKKKRPPPPNKKPFADIAKTVNLPDLETAGAAPTTLGSVYIPEGELCFINLRGGEFASRGDQTILMKNANFGLAKTDWEIFVQDGEGGAETKIADMSVNDQHQLTFAWQADAKTHPVAPYLMNCAMSFTCDGQSHEMTMREVAQAEGLVVDLSKSTIRDDWPIEFCPDPEKVKLEITGIQGAKFSVEPAPVMGAARAEAWLRIEDGGNMLSLKLETSMRRNFQLEATPYIRATPDVQPAKFNPRLMETNLQQLVNTQQQYAAGILNLQAQLKNRQVPEDQKRRLLQPRLAQAEAEQTQITTTLENLQALKQLVEKLSGSMQIKFRLYYDTGTQVDLLKAGA